MERYCPSKKALNEHDKECYYHGIEKTCPLCGKPTKEVKNGTYVPENGYTLRELGRPRTWRGHV